MSSTATCPPKNSLSFRLLTTMAIVLVLISGAVVLAITLLLRMGPTALIEWTLESNAQRIIRSLHFDASGTPDRLTLDYKLQATYDALKSDTAYRLIDRHGTVLMSSDEAASPYAPEGSTFSPDRKRFELANKGETLQVLTMPFMHDGHVFYIQIMRSERMHRVLLGSDVGKAKRIILICAVVAMLLFSLVVVATLHRMLRPLRKASAAAAQIQPDNLSARLSLDGIPTEFLPLFHAFNLALQRLDDGYRLQREFLAATAHELKTPLALIRGQIELEHAGNNTALLRDLDHMTRQVHQLLHLAEASERQNYTMERIDANDVAAEAVAQLERLAQRLSVRINHVADDSPIMIVADRGALFVLMRNLIENAIHHAPAGSTIDIDISDKAISVRDRGAGIPADAMPFLFKRFWRGPHRRDEGAGLGLSICQEIAQAHDWMLMARNAEPGALFVASFQT